MNSKEYKQIFDASPNKQKEFNFRMAGSEEVISKFIKKLGYIEFIDDKGNIINQEKSLPINFNLGSQDIQVNIHKKKMLEKRIYHPEYKLKDAGEGLCYGGEDFNYHTNYLNMDVIILLFDPTNDECLEIVKNDLCMIDLYGSNKTMVCAIIGNNMENYRHKPIDEKFIEISDCIKKWGTNRTTPTPIFRIDLREKHNDGNPLIIVKNLAAICLNKQLANEVPELPLNPHTYELYEYELAHKLLLFRFALGVYQNENAINNKDNTNKEITRKIAEKLTSSTCNKQILNTAPNEDKLRIHFANTERNKTKIAEAYSKKEYSYKEIIKKNVRDYKPDIFRHKEDDKDKQNSLTL